jgi:hypothetical protein
LPKGTAGTSGLGAPLPLGPVQSLNPVVTTLIGAGNASGLFPLIAPGSSSTLIGAGNASGLFPQIAPAATPSPAPDGLPQATERASSAVRAAADLTARATGISGLTAQVLGLIALALAVMLTITRLSVRRRGGR